MLVGFSGPFRTISAKSVPAGVLFFAALLLVSCAAESIKQRPLPDSSSQAVQRPFFVYLVGGNEVQTGGDAGFWTTARVLRAGYGPQGAQYGYEGSVFSVQIEPVDSKKRSTRAKSDRRFVTVLPRAYVPRLTSGREYVIGFYSIDLDVYQMPKYGFIVKEMNGSLRYLVNVDDGLPANQLPPEVSIRKLDNLAFSTASLTPAGCLVRREHRYVEFTYGTEARRLAPGEEFEAEGPVGKLRFALLDNSTIPGGNTCEAAEAGQFSYLIEGPGTN